MKVAVTSRGETLDDPVDPRFGRCAYFVFVETEDMTSGAAANAGSGASGGAGVQAAQRVIEADVAAVLTGNCGPNAFQALAAGGVAVHVGVGGTVRQAVEQFLAGGLTAAGAPSVGSHAGEGGQQA